MNDVAFDSKKAVGDPKKTCQSPTITILGPLSTTAVGTKCLNCTIKM